MALIKCPECNNSVSDKAKTCPHCGVDLEEELKPKSTCPECGREISEGSTVCTYCGYPYKEQKLLESLKIPVSDMKMVSVSPKMPDNKKIFSTATLMVLLFLSLIVSATLFFLNKIDRSNDISTNFSNNLEEQENKIIIELNEKENKALTYLENIYSALKNPKSLQVHSIEWIDDDVNNEFYGDSLEYDYFYLDISAQNSMGGMTRDYFLFVGDNKWSYMSDVNGKDINTEVPVGAISGFLKQENGEGEKLDVDKIMEVFTEAHQLD